MTRLAVNNGEFEFSGGEMRGEARPWPRYWSRMLDVVLWSVPLGFLIGFIWPEFTMNPSFQGGGGIVLFGMVSIPLSLVIDAAILAAFGTTPGRAIAGIRVETADHGRIDFLTALKRNGLVWVFGMALGLPPLSLFTYFHNYSRVNEGDIPTFWDEMLSTRVYDVRCTPLRIWVTAILLIVFNTGPTVATLTMRQMEVGAAGQESDPIAAMLARDAAMIKPVMIDGITRIDSVDTNGRTVTHHFTVRRQGMTKIAFDAFFDSAIRTTLCVTPQPMKMMRDYGVTYRFEYTFPDMASPLKYRVVWADCAPLTKPLAPPIPGGAATARTDYKPSANGAPD